MAEIRTVAGATSQGRRNTTRWTLRAVAVAYVTVLVVLPLGVMILRTFEDGLSDFVDSITSPEALAAIGLSLRVSALAVLINTVFGVTAALLLTRYRFPGRSVLNTLIDLPVSVSPVVAGLAFILVYGNNNWFGGSLQDLGIQIIYGTCHRPGHVLRLARLVVREWFPCSRRSDSNKSRPANPSGRTPGSGCGV